MTENADSITGVDDFGSDVVRRIEVAVALVNALAVPTAGGRPVAAPAEDPARLRMLAAAALGADTMDVTVDDARGLRALAHDLRAIVRALADERPAEAQDRLNDLLARSGAVPHLHRRSDGGDWHLHFHRPDAGLVDGWAAGCAVGLAFALSDRQAERLGVCAAPGCERLYLDLSRNRSRRFCQTACQNRVKAAQHRARQRAR